MTGGKKGLKESKTTLAAQLTFSTNHFYLHYHFPVQVPVFAWVVELGTGRYISYIFCDGFGSALGYGRSSRKLCFMHSCYLMYFSCSCPDICVSAGLPVHLSLGKQQQRADSSDQQCHQE